MRLASFLEVCVINHGASSTSREGDLLSFTGRGASASVHYRLKLSEPLEHSTNNTIWNLVNAALYRK